MGTLIPFVAAYISILKMDAKGLLVACGVALIAAGTIYRTPFPVQPMKAIILGSVVLCAGLFLSLSIDTMFKILPRTVLGVILFMAGLQLALGSRDTGAEKTDRFVVLATAALTIWNVGVAVLFGILAYQGARRGWLRI